MSFPKFLDGNIDFKLLIIIPVLLFFLFGILKNRKRKDSRKKVRSLPVSNINSLTHGLVKIKGTLEAIDFMTSTLTKIRCIGYNYKVMKWKSKNKYENDHSKKRWTTITSIEKCNDFYIKDHTGKIKVNAENITAFLTNNEKKIQKNKAVYYENLLLPDNNEYYVIGNVSIDNDNEYIIKKDSGEEQFIIDLKSYDLIFNTSTIYKIGCAILFITIFILFFILLFKGI